MAIALGGNSISKAYLGSNELFKMYLGADLVYDNSGIPQYYIPYTSTYAVDAESYLPTYDSGNATHKLITTSNNGWDDINDPALRHFFVEPGDYTGSVKTITQSGLSDSDRRTIQLYNGNNTHPGSLPTDTTNLAKVRLSVESDYWVIDRMCEWSNTSTSKMNELDGASNNIINRCLTYNTAGGSWYLYNGSNNNIIQNGYFWNDDFNIQYDNAALGLSYRSDGESTINNVFCQNDMYNKNDGVQLVRQKTFPNMNYEGTKIDCNRIWIDNGLYCNSDGTKNPSGDYAMAENAIDLKCASTNPANPVIITNNYMSGYRPSPTSGGGGIDDTTGAAMVIHYDVQNLTVRNNYFRDSRGGIFCDDPIITTALVDGLIEDNIFDDIYFYVLLTNGSNYIASDITVKDNLFINNGLADTANTIRLQEAELTDYSDNRFVDCIQEFGVTNNTNSTTPTISGNGYWNSTPIGSLSDASDTVYPSDPTVDYEDLQLTIKGFTTSPETILLANRIDLATGFVPQIVGGEAPDYPDPDLYDELDRPMPSDPIALGAAGINSPLGTIFFEFSTNQLTGNTMTFGLALDGGSFIVISLGSGVDKMTQGRRIAYGSTDASPDLLGNDFTTTNKAAIVWNGTSQLLYLNGALLNSLTVTDSVPGNTFDQIKFTRAADTTNPFLGTMNRVALWSTQLTESEAIALTTL